MARFTSVPFRSLLALLFAAVMMASTTNTFLLVSATSPPSSGHHSNDVAERALFGSSYAEDCLFGYTSSHLFGAPGATTKQKKDNGDITSTVPVATKKTASTEFGPAFVLPTASAFVN